MHAKANSNDLDAIDWSRRHENEIREQIAESYLPFVRNLVQLRMCMLGNRLDPDMALSAALGGLNFAIERFDPSMGVKFTTYATHRIQGAITDALRNADALSRTHRRSINERDAAIERLTQQLGHPPTIEEIADELDCPHDELVHSQSIETLGSNSLETIAESTKQKPSGHARRAAKHSMEETETFRELTRGIDLEGQTILFLTHYRGCDQVQIASVLGVSKSRISQRLAELHYRISLMGSDKFRNVLFGNETLP